jgi:hypothetical protein
MRRSIEYGVDDHPDDDDERPPVQWSVNFSDDCDACQDLRVDLTLEEVGAAGLGLTAHLSPDSARKLMGAMGLALKEMGQARPALP